MPDGYGSFVGTSQNSFKGMLAGGAPGMRKPGSTEKMAGPGEFVFANASKVVGVWKDGQLVSTADEE